MVIFCITKLDLEQQQQQILISTQSLKYEAAS